MKLRTIALDQFRKFDRPIRIDGLRDGINVLCGPNEHGKSTLLAAIRAALFEKHASKTDAIRSYQHRLGSTAPWVGLAFEHDGILHSIEKRFLSRPSARLVSNGAAWDGDAAEERLQALLGVSAIGRGARDAARQASSIWGALLVDQGESFAQASLGEQARATLSDCLEAELGALSGGAAIGRLLKLVQAQLSEVLDGRGNPKARFKDAIAAQASATQEIEALTTRRRLLAADLDAVQEARRRLARDSDQEQQDHTQAQLDEARRHREALLGQRTRHEAALFAVGQATADRDAPVAEAARRAQRILAMSETTQALAALDASETDARAAADRASVRLEQGRAVQAEAARLLDAATYAVAVQAARREAADRQARHAEVRAKLAMAEAEARTVAELSAAFSHARPNATAIAALRQAAMTDRMNRAALLAQATVVELSLSVPSSLVIDGTAPIACPPGLQRLEVTGPAHLTIKGAGAIRIVPASGDRDVLLASAQDGIRTLRRLLDEAGCEDMAGAEQASAHRDALGVTLEQAKRTLASMVGKEGITGLRTQEAELRPAPDAIPIDLAEAIRAHQDSIGLLERATSAELAARQALLAPDAVREAARIALGQAQVERARCQGEHTRLLAETAQALLAETDDALSARIEAAEQILLDRQRALASVIAAAPDGTLALADGRIARLQQGQENRRAGIAAVRERIVGLEARIAQEEGIGLDEQIEQARRRQETAAQAEAHDRREVAILTLLRDTLQDADRTARERYLAPLMGRMSPYLQALFPDARVRLDEDFLVAGLSRSGTADEDAEAFALLSHGTREQIAILARLAFADMLLQDGRPAFLVLDDALAFADAERMGRMFDILADAGRRMQILVLTCREEVASGLGGHRVQLEPTRAT